MADNDTKAPDVKRLFESGLSVREIAKVLDLSTQGVHWHLKRLGLKVDRSNGKQAS
jgi:DNA-binding CsgD family transcriptional regulator